MPTRDELRKLQALPLEVKVLKTKQRIREWVREFGTDGVYVSFSGWKDSTVLLHIVREMYPDVPAVFCDTGLEYPEIREFVKTFDNVEWLRPKMNFRKVIETYGYPFISKEVSGKAEGAVNWLWGTGKADWAISEFVGCMEQSEGDETLAKLRASETKEEQYRIFENRPEYGTSSSRFNKERWWHLLFAPFKVSDRCCGVMKKTPFKRYERESGRVAIIATMAEESMLRTSKWLKTGCNAFEAKHKNSTPMAFWTGQDVLQYIRTNNIPIASVYGDIVYVAGDGNEYDNILAGSAKLKTTGLDRTGCMFCGYGCHLEKPGRGRFETMKETHPKQYNYIMKPWDEGGLGYKGVIDWINENCNVDIRY